MKKGFTLVELLATIILLGLIATLIYTSVNASIDKANKNALKDELIIMEKTIRSDSVDITFDTYLNYTYNAGILYQDERKIDKTGGNSKYTGSGYIDQDGKVEALLNNGDYCAIYNDGKVTVAPYDATTCKLSRTSTAADTNSSCFEVNDDGVLTRYKCYPGNTYGLEAISDVVIPSEVNGITVKEIGIGAFSAEDLIIKMYDKRYDIINSLSPLHNVLYDSKVDFSDYEIYSITPITKNSGFKMSCNKVQNRYNDFIILNDTTFYNFYKTSDIDFNNYGYCTIDSSYYTPKYSNGISSVIIPNTVTKINDAAFMGNTIVELKIPDSVTSIGKFAFCFNSISNLDIGTSLKKIDKNAFFYNSINSLFVPENVKEIGSSAFGSNKISKLEFESYKTEIDGNSFYNNNLTGDDALIYKLNSDGTKDKSYLVGYAGPNTGSKITIPNNVKIIGKNAFYNSEIDNIVLPEGLEEIGDGAFYYVYSTVNIPSTVTKIGVESFYRYGKSSITIPSGLEEISEGSFISSSLTTINIPEGVKKIGKAAFMGVKSVTNIVIPSSVKYIDRNAFAFNLSLTNVSLNEGLTYIGDGAFAETKLSSVTIPSTVTKIGASSFRNSSKSLKTITNKTGRVFDFDDILYKNGPCVFEKGTCDIVTVN